MATQVIDLGKEQTTFDTGGRREIIVGRGRFDLIPPEAWTEFAQHMEAGANKYADRNWEKGLPLNTFINSLMRHTIASYWQRDQSENHEAAMIWNASTYTTTLRRIEAGTLPKELDTRP